MHKRGQLFDAAVTHIMIAVVVLAIIVFGWVGFTNMKERHENTAMLDFQSRFTAEVDKVATKRGNVQTIALPIAAKVEEVCFYDPFYPSPWDPPIEKEILNEMVAGGENVFLFSSNEPVPVGFQTRDIKTEHRLLCINTTNAVFRAKIEGRGTHAFLSPVDEDYDNNEVV